MKHAFIALIAAATAVSASAAMAQTAKEVLGPAAGKDHRGSASGRALGHGLVFIQCRPENQRIVPVFAPNALDVSPRIGHVHVIVDDAPWHWADASGEPLILVGLPAGPHTVKIILADANHQPLDQAVVAFVVSAGDAATGHH